MKFCDQLKAARKKADISQPIAAKRIGIGIGTYRNWEQDRQKPMPPMQEVALARIANDAEASKPSPPQEFASIYKTAFDMVHAVPEIPLSEIRRFLSRQFPNDYPEAHRRAIDKDS